MRPWPSISSSIGQCRFVSAERRCRPRTMSRSQLRISVAAILLTRVRSSPWMPATTRRRDLGDEDVGVAAEVPDQPAVDGVEPGPERQQEHRDGGLGAGLCPPHEGGEDRVAGGGVTIRPVQGIEEGSGVGEVGERRLVRRTSPGTAAGTRGWWSIGGAAHAAPARRIATDACLTAGRPKRLIVARSGRRAPLGFGEREARAEERRGPWGYLRSSRFRVPQPRQVQVAGSAAMYSWPRVKRTCRWPERITPSSRPQLSSATGRGSPAR